MLAMLNKRITFTPNSSTTQSKESRILMLPLGLASLLPLGDKEVISAFLSWWEKGLGDEEVTRSTVPIPLGEGCP